MEHTVERDIREVLELYDLALPHYHRVIHRGVAANDERDPVAWLEITVRQSPIHGRKLGVLRRAVPGVARRLELTLQRRGSRRELGAGRLHRSNGVTGLNLLSGAGS